MSLLFRSYSNLPLLKFVSVVKVTDPKIVNTFAEMISVNEIEQILVDTNNDETWKIFLPSQLLRLLEVIAPMTSYSEKACINVSKGFLAEAKNIQERKSNNDGKLIPEDLKQLDRWQLLMKRILELNLTGFKKYNLLNLLLDIIAAMPAHPKQDDLTHGIMRSMSTDLQSRNVHFPQLCKSWSRCIDKLEWIDEGLVKELLKTFKAHVNQMAPEGCFDAFLSDDGAYDKQISDILFERSASLFEEKKDGGFWSKFTGYMTGSNKVHIKNLGRLFSRVIENIRIPTEENSSAFMKAVTDVPATSSMIKFYPKLYESKLLEPKVANKADLILKHIGTFINDLRAGDLTLDVLNLLKDPSRVERLMTLAEVFKAGNNFDRNALKKLIEMRLHELNEFLHAGQDMGIFKSNFKQVFIFLQI